MAEPRHEGPDVRRWARLVWRRKWTLLGVVVLLPVGIYVVSSLLPKTYQAGATINVKPTAAASTLFSNQITAGSDIGEAQTLIQTTAVGRRAAQLLGQSPSEARTLLSHISVSQTNPAESQGSFLTIAARDSNPVMAARITNAFARAASQVRTANAIHGINRTIATLIAQGASGPAGGASRAALAEQLQQLRGLRAGQRGTTPIVETAAPPGSPISPRPLRNTAIALVLALLIAAGLAPLLDRIDRRIREPEELEELLEPPLLATIPEDAFPGHLPGANVREAFQTLRANLTYFNVDRPLSTLVVSSAAQQDGKTTVAINLALAYAQDGRDVVLVDADLRRPQIATRLGKEAAVTLDAVLVGESRLEEGLIEVEAGGGRLRIVPGATPPNPTVLLGSQRMRSLLAELAEKHNIVIIDTPAVLAVSDAIPLINQAAGTVLVAQLNRTTKDGLRRADQVVRAAGGTVLGTIATGARSGGMYGGYYGYGYNGGEDERDEAGVEGNGSGRRLPSMERGGGSAE